MRGFFVSKITFLLCYSERSYNIILYNPKQYKLIKYDLKYKY